jgi:hypothetical protein
VSALVVTLALGADPAVAVEAGDDGDHRGEVGLVVVVDDGLRQGHVAVGARVAGDVADVLDLAGQGSCGALVSLGPAGRLGVGLGLVAAEGCGLTLALLLGLFELPAQLSDVLLQPCDGGIPLLAAGANRGWRRVSPAVEVGAPRPRGKTSFVYFTVTMYRYNFARKFTFGMDQHDPANDGRSKRNGREGLAILRKDNWVHGGTVMYRSNIILRVGLDNLAPSKRYGVDHVFWQKVSQVATMDYLSHILVEHRLHEGSMTQGGR